MHRPAFPLCPRASRDGPSLTPSSAPQLHEAAAIRCLTFSHSGLYLLSCDDLGRVKFSKPTLEVLNVGAGSGRPGRGGGAAGTMCRGAWRLGRERGKVAGTRGSGGLDLVRLAGFPSCACRQVGCPGHPRRRPYKPTVSVMKHLHPSADLYPQPRP